MTTYIAANNARAKLSAGLGGLASDVTVTISGGDASKFPAINNAGATPAEYSYLTLQDAAGHVEHMKISRHDTASASLTVVRGTAAGIVGTSDSGLRAWSIGDSAAITLNAQLVNDAFVAAIFSASSAASSASSAASSASSAASSAADALAAPKKDENNVFTGANYFYTQPIAAKTLKLGNNADTSKNFLITTPSIADGTLTIQRESGAVVASIDAAGKVVFPGNAQTIQNVKATPGRIAGTAYPNDTGQPIVIVVSIANAVASGYMVLNSFVDGVHLVGSTISTTLVGEVLQSVFPVPAGSTYSIGVSGSNAPSVSTWKELR